MFSEIPWSKVFSKESLASAILLILITWFLNKPSPPYEYDEWVYCKDNFVDDKTTLSFLDYRIYKSVDNYVVAGDFQLPNGVPEQRSFDCDRLVPITYEFSKKQYNFLIQECDPLRKRIKILVKEID